MAGLQNGPGEPYSGVLSFVPARGYAKYQPTRWRAYALRPWSGFRPVRTVGVLLSGSSGAERVSAESSCLGLLKLVAHDF